jgi:hypothetical protein
MSKNKKPEDTGALSSVKDGGVSEKEDKKPVRTKTIYTHGDTHVVPIDTDVAKFLKEKYPKG